MKTKTLIRRLQEIECNPNAPLHLYTLDGPTVHTCVTNDNAVCLYSSDNSKIEPMTIVQLIDCMKTLNSPEADVRLDKPNGEVALFCIALIDNETAWLEGEFDTDLREEISVRFQDAIEDGTDEVDVYGDMLECGIDVDMVRRYMGNNVADTMKKFCEEHGLV